MKETSTPRFYTSFLVLLGTFIGGPIVAGVLLAKNFKLLNKKNAAIISLIIGAIITILIAFLLNVVLDYKKLPSYLIPGLSLAIAALIFEFTQAKSIKELDKSIYKKASAWNSVLYGLGGMLVLFILIFLFHIFWGKMDGYAGKVKVKNKVYLHYKEDVDKSIAKKVAYILDWSTYFDQSYRGDIFLKDRHKFYRMDIVLVSPQILQDSAVLNSFNTMEQFLNANLSIGKPIKIGFTNSELTETYDLEKVDLDKEVREENGMRLKKYTITPLQHVYYNDSIQMEDVKVVEKAVRSLKYYFPINNKTDIFLIKIDETYQLKLFVEKSNWEKQDLLFRLKEILSYVEYESEKDMQLYQIDKNSGDELLLESDE